MTDTSVTTQSGIPQPALLAINFIIENDEGGFRLNEEANGDWNYAGMLSSFFVEQWKNASVPAPDRDVVKDWILNKFPAEDMQKLVVSMYYEKFYLPLSTAVVKLFGNDLTAANHVQLCELSCAVNCGLGVATQILKTLQGAIDISRFCDLWEDHYIKLVVDNAVAWKKYAIEAEEEALASESEQGFTVQKPTQLRATNLQGWINRVRHYRPSST